MKYIITDVNTGIILAETTNKKAASMCQSVVQDTNLTFLLPGYHQKIYNLVQNEFLIRKKIRFYNNDISEYNTLSTEIDNKLSITQVKLSLMQHLLVGAEGNMLYKNYLFDNEFVSIIQSDKIELLHEYALIRKLNLEEAKKEIDIKVSNYQTAVVKIQALIDRWMELISLENNLEILESYKKDIIDSFFYIDV